MIKLLVSDLDHTLLTYENDKTLIKDYDLEVLRRLQDQGIKVIVASGRDHGFIRNCLSSYDLSLDVIGANGSTAVINDEVIISHLVDVDALKMVYEYVVSTYPNIYMKASSIDNQEYRHDTLVKMRYRDVYQPISLKQFLMMEDIKVNRFVVSSEQQELFLEVMADLKDKFSAYFEINQSSSHLMDITPKGIDKGKTVKDVIAYLGFDKSEVASIGDSPNDISMFKNTSISFAMVNGHHDVLNAADHIVDRFADVYEYLIKRLSLGNLD